MGSEQLKKSGHFIFLGFIIVLLWSGWRSERREGGEGKGREDMR